MKKASRHIALGLMLLLIFGTVINFNTDASPKSLLNDFWQGVVAGLLLALFIFNFYLGYIEKDINRTRNMNKIDRNKEESRNV